jgi:hypothetical protein
MGTKKALKGESLRDDTPDWQPLLNLLAGDFMWMFAVELEDGRRVNAYKHYWTRRYLHLDADSVAFVYTRDGRYLEVEADWLLDKVLEPERKRRQRERFDDE